MEALAKRTDAMAEAEQGVLVINPKNDLKFRGPFNTQVVSYITLTNVSDKRVHFKLKTTAPKKYFVRPNSGVLVPKDSVEVAVGLQPFVYNSAEKHKHKFMVQFMVEPEGWLTSAEELWKCIDPDKIMNYKLKCVFDMQSVPGNELKENIVPESNAVVNEEKVKRTTVEGSKAAASKPAVTSAASAADDDELQRVANEVRQRRENEIALQQQNAILKEELMRLHQNISMKEEARRNAYSPPAVQGGNGALAQVPIYYYVVAVLVAFLGFWLGRFNC